MRDHFVICGGLVQRHLSNIEFRHTNVMHALISGIKPINNFPSNHCSVENVSYTAHNSLSNTCIKHPLTFTYFIILLVWEKVVLCVTNVGNGIEFWDKSTDQFSCLQKHFTSSHNGKVYHITQ